ncbi:lutropin subunit beta [Nothobranchius furzeri]|uniref:Gonadotropin subunit beta-2 n=2 Tax=Nothobranchius furzeri TaxID=105023 RepID=A0A1A8U009_NOTFU|nr:gonadotropin subunit beta-2 [Nothobranchius furzeri]KAF7227487.1 gonadotropin subunit beta-2-like [Nothobranchius furzeri]
MVLQASKEIFPLMLSLLLGSSSIFWHLPPAVAFQLPLCQLTNQTISLEKEGCFGCHPVETTICSGHCFTKYPVGPIRFSKVYQHVCTYQNFSYKTFELPDCLPGVDPIVTYPVALSCRCGRCSMDTSDCTFESLKPDFCMNDITFYY